MNNFGDLLGPLIVEKILRQRGLDPATGEGRRIVTVGSILTMARSGDVVWGSGVNGKHLDHQHTIDEVDFRAVRGPRTAAFLNDLGATSPSVFGDPGLLVATLWPDLRVAGPQRRRTLLAPNLHDQRRMRLPGAAVLDPTRPVFECLSTVANSGFVVASSLHAAIVADSFGVPARFVISAEEPEFKYRDYLEGTGRYDVTIARTVNEALQLGPHEPLDWEPYRLLAQFPEDLWADG